MHKYDCEWQWEKKKHTYGAIGIEIERECVRTLRVSWIDRAVTYCTHTDCYHFEVGVCVWFSSSLYGSPKSNECKRFAFDETFETVENMCWKRYDRYLLMTLVAGINRLKKNLKRKNYGKKTTQNNNNCTILGSNVPFWFSLSKLSSWDFIYAEILTASDLKKKRVKFREFNVTILNVNQKNSNSFVQLHLNNFQSEDKTLA